MSGVKKRPGFLAPLRLPRGRVDLADSYKVGDFLMVQGDLAEALKWYRDGLANADRLAKAGPENAFWHHNLSLSYSKVGDVLMAQGDLAEAVKLYRDGRPLG